MADVGDTGGITSRWLIVLCLSASAGLNAPTYYILKNLSDAITSVRGEIKEKTADRFFRRDHLTYKESHALFAEQRFNGVEFRFSRNEAEYRAGIAQCLAEIEKLKDEK